MYRSEKTRTARRTAGTASAGFSLVELIIVIAILAALTAIVVPNFSGAREKAARAVDMSNARSIKEILSTAIIDGDIQFPSDSPASGIFVLVCRDRASAPVSYGQIITDKKTTYCGADKGVSLSGEVSTNYNNEFKALTAYLDASMGDDFSKLKVSAKSDAAKTSGWDWYVVEYIWNPKTQSPEGRIYSGMSGQTSNHQQIKVGTSNLEKLMENG